MKLDYSIIYFSKRGFGLGIKVLSTDWVDEDITFKYCISLNLLIIDFNLFVLK